MDRIKEIHKGNTHSLFFSSNRNKVVTKINITKTSMKFVNRLKIKSKKGFFIKETKWLIFLSKIKEIIKSKIAVINIIALFIFFI